MALYIDVIVKATIKIQDPYTDKHIEEVKENTYLHCSEELVEENYEYKIVDAD